MKPWMLILCFWTISAFAEEPPALLGERLEQVEQLTGKAKERLAELARTNLQALNRLALEGTRRPDPSLRLWAERERRVHESTRFCSLSRPERVTGYPEDLQRLSDSLRSELATFRDQLKGQKRKILDESEAAFDARVRALVRTNHIEAAERERAAFRNFNQRKPVKDLDRLIREMDRLLSGRSHRRLWRRPRGDPTPAPPDALFLFEANNPAFQSFVESVSVVSNGSPHRGKSGAGIGRKHRVAGKRGLTMLAVMGGGEILRAHYDTYESKSEGLRLVKDVKALPYGAFVVLFAHDDATRRFPGEAQSTLFRLGASKGLSDLPYRSAYLLIGVKGMRPGGAEERWDGERVEMNVDNNT